MLTTTQDLSKDHQKRTHILLLLILGAAAVIRAYIINLNIGVLLDQGLVQDDAFYYYVIARNILEHASSSFDNINLTNGFHPLWQAICLPIFYVWHGDIAIRIMLAIASCFDLLSIFLVFLILQKIVRNSYAALTGAAILALHGTIIRTWFNGMETAISLFSLLWLLHEFIYLQDNKSTKIRDHLWFGFVAAISFLARTDNAIIILTLFSFLYIPPLFINREFKSGFIASSMLIALISPWLIWNIENFGSIVQISGKIRDNTWLTDSSPPDRPFYQTVIYGVWVSLSPVKIVFEKMFSPNNVTYISGYFYFLINGFILIYLKNKDTFFKKQLSLLWPFFIGVTALFLYHAGVRHFIRGWYNASILLALTLLFCLFFDWLITRQTVQRHAVNLFILIIALLFVFYTPYTYTKSSEHPPIDPRISVAQWLNQKTPSNAIIGAANAGIVGYYTERTVINLDGVVNENAFYARTKNQLHRYIYESNIDYLADHKGSIVHLCKPNVYFTCTQIETGIEGTLIMRVNKTN